MNAEAFSEPGFWLALLAGAGLLPAFAYWLITGARKQRLSKPRGTGGRRD